MEKLQEEFECFYKEINRLETKEIIDKKHMLKECFLDKFPQKLKEEFEINIKKGDICFIDQGSYAIHTTIKHTNITPDIDIAVKITMNKCDFNNIIIVKLKELVQECLKYGDRKIEIKEPCICVTYTEKDNEKYHLDFPIYIECDDKLYLARGKKGSKKEDVKWELADPDGLNEYFNKYLGDVKNEENQQRKRVLSYIKYWKAEKYGNNTNTNEVPPSIAFTILVCKQFKYAKDNDLKALYESVKAINKSIFNKEGELLECNLPVEPKIDCFYKLKKSENYVQNFYKKWNKFEDALEKILIGSGCDDCTDLKAIFGAGFPEVETGEVNNEDTFAR